jgi:hypothetical protein
MAEKVRRPPRSRLERLLARKRSLGWLGASLGFLAAVAVGVVIWFAARNAKNAPAVQAVTSYVLVLVTGTYVVITQNLVRTQRRQARYDLEMRATAELARILHQVKRFLLPALEEDFPLPGRGPRPKVDRLKGPDRQLLDLYWDLNRLTPDLPEPLRTATNDAWRTVHAASSDTVNILWAFAKEDEAASEEDRPWTWEGAAGFYRDEHVVGKTREPGAWYDMIRGVNVHRAVTTLQALDEDVERARRR